MPKPLPKNVKDFVSSARVCRIATVRPNGEPHVIPVCPVFDGELTVHVDIDPGYVTARNIEAEPRVTVLIDEYSEDWSQMNGVVLRCKAEPVSGDEKERAWERIRAKFPQHEEIGWEPRLTLALRIRKWSQYS